MISPGERLAIATQARLTTAGLRYLERTVQTGCSRIIRAGRGNLASRFPSPRDKKVLTTESMTLECAYALRWEFDHSVLEAYANPPAIRLSWTCPLRGKRYAYDYTPDFLLLRAGKVSLVECKHNQDAQRLARDKPGLWSNEGGIFRFPPAEVAAAQLGMAFELCLGDELNPLLTANLLALFDYLIGEITEKERKLATKIRGVLLRERYMTLLEIVSAFRLPNLSLLHRLIAHRELQANLDYASVSDPTQCILGATPDDIHAAREAQEFWFRTTAADEDPSSRDPKLWELSESERRDTLKAYLRARALAAGEIRAAGRTDRRLRKKYRDALASGRDPVRELASRKSRSGYYGSHLDKDDERLVRKVIEKLLLDTRQLTVKEAWRRYLGRSRRRFLTPVAYRTFLRRARECAPDHWAFCRGGDRARAAAKPSSDPRDRAVLPQRAFQRAHLDSTPSDVRVLDHTGLRDLGRPHLTLMVDDCSQYPLAWWFHFRPPSRFSLSMAVRRCVQTHHRLPTELVIDGGREYHSEYADLFFARYGVISHTRPPHNGRFGAAVESSFKTCNARLIWQQFGNTLNDKRGRSASSSAKSRENTRLRIDELIARFEWFVDNVFGQRQLASRYNRQARELFDTSVALHGLPRERRIAFDEEFLRLSAPEVSRLYGVDPQRGIHYRDRWYTSRELSQLHLRGAVASLREEPCHPSLIYALVDGRSYDLYASDAARTERISFDAKMYEALEWEAGIVSRPARQREQDESYGRKMLKVTERRPPRKRRMSTRPRLASGSARDATREAQSALFRNVRAASLRPLEVLK